MAFYDLSHAICGPPTPFAAHPRHLRPIRVFCGHPALVYDLSTPYTAHPAPVYSLSVPFYGFSAPVYSLSVPSMAFPRLFTAILHLLRPFRARKGQLPTLPATAFIPQTSRGENGGLCPHPLKGPDP